MAANQQKTPFVKSVNLFTEGKINEALQLLGKSVPATVDSVDETGLIATVNIAIQSSFPLLQVTCPVATTEYNRPPLQKGDPGYLVPADYFLGGLTGLGDGQADFTPQANLTNSVFVPLGNNKVGPNDDQTKYLLYGPTGVILRDKGKNCVFTLTPDGIQITLHGLPYMTFASNGITLTFGGNEITMTSAGINIDTSGGTGGITINGGSPGTEVDGKPFLPHTHTGVVPGGGNSGPVT